MNRRVTTVLLVGLLAAGCTPLDSEPDEPSSSRASSATPSASAEPTPEPTATSTGAVERPASLPEDAEWYEGDGFAMYIGADWEFDGTNWVIGDIGTPESIVVNVVGQSLGTDAEPTSFMDQVKATLASTVPGFTLNEETEWVQDGRTYVVIDYQGTPGVLDREMRFLQAIQISNGQVFVASMLSDPKGWAAKRREISPYFRTLVVR